MTIIDPQFSSQNLVLHPKKSKEMITVTPLSDGRFKVRINSSSLGVIQECLRKAKYSLLDGWRNEAESPATLFGSAIHAALEVFYSGNLDERQLPNLSALETMGYGHKEAGEEENLILRATRAFINKAQPLTTLPESDKRSVQNGVWLLHEYFKKFIDDPYIAHRDDNGPFVERVFTLPYHENESFVVELFGTIDFVFRHTVTGDLIPGDHKTTSSLSFGDSSYFDRERPNTQYTIYSLAAREIFGISSENFLVSIFEVKQKPKTARGSGPSFPRQITKRTADDFIELKDIIEESVERYLYAISKERFPLGPVDACGKYGGCGFRQVCASPINIRETILNNKYTRS